MKKLLSLATLLVISAPAIAGFNGDNQAQKMSVAKALKAKDNTAVQLTGKISSQVDDDEFIFRDSSGEIRIDVEDSAWQDLNVGPNDTITIFGRVDSDALEKNSVDVYRVTK